MTRYIKQNTKKELFIGIGLSLMVSLIGFLSVSSIFIQLLTNGANDHLSFSEKFVELCQSDALSKILTLGSLPNLLAFHLLIKKKQDYKARGVLLTVIVLTFIFFALKLS